MGIQNNLPDEQRLEDDRYLTPYGICTKAMQWLDWYMGRFYNHIDRDKIVFLEPCVGEGDLLPEIKEYFPDSQIVTNDIQDFELIESTGEYAPNDATDPDTWKHMGTKVDRLGGSKQFVVSITNPPFKCWVPIAQQSVHWADLTLLLLPINVQEPCYLSKTAKQKLSKRDHFLKPNSKHQVLQGYFNTRPQFRPDRKGSSDSKTVGWHGWDKNFDTEVTAINPFRYWTNWQLDKPE